MLGRDGQLALIEGQWKGMAPRDEYAEIYDHLPLFGGRQDYEIGELIRSLGYSSVTTEPLMEPELWLETPTYPRYLVLAHS